MPVGSISSQASGAKQEETQLVVVQASLPLGGQRVVHPAASPIPQSLLETLYRWSLKSPDFSLHHRENIRPYFLNVACSQKAVAAFQKIYGAGGFELAQFVSVDDEFIHRLKASIEKEPIVDNKDPRFILIRHYIEKGVETTKKGNGYA